jgi:hypothetical protein
MYQPNISVLIKYKTDNKIVLEIQKNFLNVFLDKNAEEYLFCGFLCFLTVLSQF